MSNGMVSDEITALSQVLLQRLLAEKNVRIQCHLWSEDLRIELQQQLKMHNIDDMTIYRLKENAEYIACIQGFQPNTADLETIYKARGKLLFVLPILAILLIIFGFTALMARDLNAMMSAEFLIFTPFFIGAVSQYFYSYQQMNKVGSMLGQQAFILFIIILLSVVVLREGVICLVMASPLLYLWQVCGAVAMRILCKSFWMPSVKIYSISIVPLLLLVADPFAQDTTFATTRNEVLINAPIEQVFYAINNIADIKEEELKASPVFWMGFPKPISGMTVRNREGDGLTRQIHWQRGIYFEETITHNEPPYLLAWQYKFTPQSFPKGSLDDHVEIGGEYFDLASTDYRLEKINQHQTKLTLTIDYRLSTEINWYAKPWANFVLNEFSDVVLHVYKKRLET